MSKINQKTLLHARHLRKNMTIAEQKLWRALRCRQLQNYRFRKQVPIGHYIVDFVCHEVKIIIELDGGQHNQDEVLIYDQQRTEWLTKQGYLVQRFWNTEVLQQLPAVVELVVQLCLGRKINTPHVSYQNLF